MIWSDISVGRWLFILTVPVLTLLFALATVSTYRTHGAMDFDSGVLLWCMCINLIACWLEIYCSHIVALSNQCLQAFMMIYILYRVSGLRQE